MRALRCIFNGYHSYNQTEMHFFMLGEKNGCCGAATLARPVRKTAIYTPPCRGEAL